MTDTSHRPSAITYTAITCAITAVLLLVMWRIGADTASMGVVGLIMLAVIVLGGRLYSAYNKD
ncbi:MAG: hypothetical protein JWN82_50 [Candidatus Saccharibacteria bacterium]|nr:hypothetical protein [Candidatus Saccharibacteria bacterium]